MQMTNLTKDDLIPEVDDTFALLLSADLVSFAMMTYVYRTETLQVVPSRVWIIVGSTVIIGVFFSSLLFA